ncbi:DUF7004 family protein [Qipengyuania huizhouensis]|uniref:DUF7004 family protein n=1 Tax=Qipengyuania huizhouensis TaxID=2867245 RepID=UPI001C875924|nr:hypothetical protein [Qipengyuania huizhouensis]MBX7459837.1 hypothetical protein [Qipengyuania huizhouensis]
MKTFADGRKIDFGRGSFDDWCVFVIEKDGNRRAPLDSDYFAVVADVCNRHGSEELWRIYERIYERTNRQVEDDVLSGITVVSERFGDDAVAIDIALTCIYLGMIAEENKRNTKLGKRIKRLAMHQLVHEGLEVSKVVNFSKGMKAHEIDALCRERGF